MIPARKHAAPTPPLARRGAQIRRRARERAFSFSELLRKHPSYESSAGKALAVSLPVYLFARAYCDLTVKGTENIPYGSRFVWTHNHSGWIALDAVLIGHLIGMHNRAERFDWSVEKMGPWALLQWLNPDEAPGDWGVTFWNAALARAPGISRIIRSMHGLPAETLREPRELREFRIFGTPAEGEEGNCKSSFTQLYQLQRFRTGIARLALDAKVESICPAAIIGPEETLPSLGKFRLLRRSLGTILPIPLAVPPIPVRWVVRFLPPIETAPYLRRLDRSGTRSERYQVYSELSERVREKIRAALAEETRDRKPFRPWFLDRAESSARIK